ncbi:putative Ig domain-containing protein, partial [Patescibacteria group bacterium]|nr:putative Ig domain-containing protein [Patescibacteria group bacterium]
MSKKTLLIFFFLLLPTIIIASFSSLRSAVAENFWRFIGSGTSPDRPTHIVKINTNITEETNSTSPVLNYTFNGPDVFYSAGAISSITDKSGNNNTGTANNLTAYPGRVGQGLKFNGTNSYIEPTTSINPIQSISFWIKSDSTTQSIMQLNATQNISIVSGTITTTGFSSTVFVDGVNTTIYPNDNDWHNITITTGTGINANDIDIGRIDTTYYSGLLDEVVMHNTALNATQVANLARFGRRRVVVRGEPLPPPPEITTTSLPDGQVTTAYSQTVLAISGTTPYSWSIKSGSLPAGLSLTSSTGVISGTPTTEGTSNFTIKVTDVNARTDNQSLSIVVDPSYSNTILNTSGLVSYWQMNSGFVSGADVLDSKGTNHGTKTGATLTTSDFVDGGGAG